MMGAALLLGACAVTPVESVSLPRSNLGLPATTSPTRSAILSTAYGFGNPGVLAGQPDRAARLAAQLEYLAVALQSEFREFSPLVPLRMQQARAELRQALGVRTDAPAQAVIAALDGAAEAGRDQAAARAALQPVAQPGRDPLAVLAALPPLPVSAAATAAAERELMAPEFFPFARANRLLVPGVPPR
jgi:hypothetical protein